MKKLWEIVAHEVNRQHNKNVTASHCENRWRVIERNYKKYIDDNNKTGRARKIFEYSTEMDEIFGGKRNVNPEILLSSSSIHYEASREQEAESTQNSTAVTEDTMDSTRTKNVYTPKTEPKPSLRRARKRILNKNMILEQIRADKKEFHSNLIKVHQEKLEFLKSKHEDYKKIQENKMDEIRKQNELLETKNQILDKYLKLKVSLPTGIF